MPSTLSSISKILKSRIELSRLIHMCGVASSGFGLSTRPAYVQKKEKSPSGITKRPTQQVLIQELLQTWYLIIRSLGERDEENYANLGVDPPSHMYGFHGVSKSWFSHLIPSTFLKLAALVCFS